MTECGAIGGRLPLRTAFRDSPRDLKASRRGKSDPETVLRELLDQHWEPPTTDESEPGEPDQELDQETIRSLGPLVVSSDP
jgi:hypothetical protein